MPLKRPRNEELPAQRRRGPKSRTAPATSRRDAEEFHELVEQARCMIVVLRDDRCVAYFNAFAEEVTGYAAAEAVGKDYLKLLVPESARDEIAAFLQRAACGDFAGEVEHPLVPKRGPVRWVLSAFRSLNRPPGQPSILLTAQDITLQKHTERKLRKRTHDLGERIKELNCLFGLSKLEEEPDIDLDGILRGLVDLLPPAWQYPRITCAQIVFKDKQYRTYNFQATLWKQAAPIWLHGEPVGMVEVCYLEETPPCHEGPFLAEERRLLDALAERVGRIAERIDARRELRRERDFAESLIQMAPAIVVVLDPRGRILRINRYLEDISGYRLEEIRGQEWFKVFLPPRLRAHVRSLFAKAIGRRQRIGMVGPLVTKDGREREIEWYDKILLGPNDAVVGLLAIGQDITDRRKLEKEIVDISTREQQRIGQELHDGLGQELTGLGYLAESLYCDLRGRGALEVDTANKLADGLEAALEQARTIARGLVPVEIDAEGLASALEQLAAQTEHRCGISCACECDELAPVGDTAAATQVFRIVQEAVNNAVRHAQARHIRIEVRTDQSQIVFRVQDDGRGIPQDSKPTTGMGLQIMHYRADVIGAALSVRPVGDGGTLVTCSLPRADPSRQTG